MSIKSIHNLIMKEIREEGYYWVKYEDSWEIAYYRHSDPLAWTLTAYKDDSWWFYDSDFDEIDENRITREPKISHFLIKGSDLVAVIERKPDSGDKLFGLL